MTVTWGNRENRLLSLFSWSWPWSRGKCSSVWPDKCCRSWAFRDSNGKDFVLTTMLASPLLSIGSLHLTPYPSPLTCQLITRKCLERGAWRDPGIEMLKGQLSNLEHSSPHSSPTGKGFLTSKPFFKHLSIMPSSLYSYPGQDLEIKSPQCCWHLGWLKPERKAATAGSPFTCISVRFLVTPPPTLTSHFWG